MKLNRFLTDIAFDSTGKPVDDIFTIERKRGKRKQVGTTFTRGKLAKFFKRGRRMFGSRFAK